MKKPTVKRVLAYLVDIIIVSLIATALSGAKVLNPYYDKYEEAQEKYQTLVEEATENTQDLSGILNSPEFTDLTYEVSKTGVFVTIYTLVISFLYFVCFQFYTKGKTLGKLLTKIEIVSNNKEELTFVQLFKRSIIINSLATSLLGIIAIFTLSKASYLDCSKYIQLIETTLLLVSFGFVLYREDGRGLHDLFGGTRVIDSRDKEFFLKHEEVKEAKVIDDEVKEAEIVEEEVKVTKPRKRRVSVKKKGVE